MRANTLGEESTIIWVPSPALLQFLETSGSLWSQRCRTEFQGQKWHQGTAAAPTSPTPHFWTSPISHTCKCTSSAPPVTEVQEDNTGVGEDPWEPGKRSGLRVLGGSSEAWPSLIPLSPEAGMVVGDPLCKLEYADVMTLLARRYDRRIRSLSSVPE